MDRSVFVGWEPREADAFAVAVHSIKRRLHIPIPVFGLVLDDLRERGIYTRPHGVRETKPGHFVKWDEISDAPMATEFACSRFLVPELVRQMSVQKGRNRWAVFMDCDMLVRSRIDELFNQCDDRKAVMVVKHNHQPTVTVKMDGQEQTRYARKNWSSVMAFNVDHPANKALTVEVVNSLPGRDLHAFKWLDDDLIGELDASWNYLVGHTNPEIDADIVHFTDGVPSMKGYENCEYAEQWRDELIRWARQGVML